MKKVFINQSHLFLVILIISLLAGCGNNAVQPATTTENAANEATGSASAPIPIRFASYKIGVNVGGKAELEIINKFKEDFAGKYELIVEEIPDEQGYLEKMKVLISSKDLPNIVDGKGNRDLAVEAGVPVEIEEMIRADEQYLYEIGGEALIDSQRSPIDNKVYSVPNTKMAFGYYYNKEMFEAAGITPAKTWDEFITNCQALKDAGYTPLAINVAWMGGATLTSYLCSNSERGKEIVNQASGMWKVFQEPEIYQGINFLVDLFNNYSTPNCLDDLSELQMSTFCQGQAAILPNGSWQITNFYDEKESLPGFDKKVGCALFPNDSCLTSYDVGSYITGDSPEVIEGAFEFLKAYTNAEGQKIWLELSNTLPAGPAVTMNDEFKSENPILAEMVEVLSKAKTTGRNLDALMPNAVWTQYVRELQAIAQKTKTVEQAAKDLETLAGQSAN